MSGSRSAHYQRGGQRRDRELKISNTAIFTRLDELDRFVAALSRLAKA